MIIQAYGIPPIIVQGISIMDMYMYSDTKAVVLSPDGETD